VCRVIQLEDPTQRTVFDDGKLRESGGPLPALSLTQVLKFEQVLNLIKMQKAKEVAGRDLPPLIQGSHAVPGGVLVEQVPESTVARGRLPRLHQGARKVDRFARRRHLD
jgi:hypothetical protein